MSKSKSVKVKYVFDETYNPKYVTGAYGGPISPTEITMNFYLERQPIPNSVEVIIDENEQFVKEVTDTDEYAIVRVVQNGVIMNLTEAENFYRWLGNHIEEMKGKK